MIREAIARLVAGQDLDEASMAAVMREIMTGEATPAQIAACITALRVKGETVEEITGAARVMRECATRIDVTGVGEILVDTCGTGGDQSGTFNVSTTAAFVVAGAGVPVAKHGNRSISSRCGSADVLEALGVDLDLGPAAVATAIRTVGIGFLFAPKLHPAMKHAIGPRREIGIRTIFNVLGPLTNPAGANVQVMGVFASELTEPLAAVLGRLGARRALVVCGEGNMDELTVTGATKVSEWRNGEVTTWSVVPEDVGLTRAERKAISGADDPVAAAEQVRAILGGEPGARREMTALNAGAALMAAGQAQDLASGVRLALATIDSGAALRCLDRLVAFCQEQRA